jgi:hypothetical protein
LASAPHLLKARPSPSACSIRASLFERPEQRVAVATRKTTAFVLNLDRHAIGADADPQRDGRMRLGEVECVLQQVSDDGGHGLSIGLDGHTILHREDA